MALYSLPAYFICVFHLIPMTTLGREATDRAWACTAQDPPKPSGQAQRTRAELRAPYPVHFSPPLLATESFLVVTIGTTQV